MSRNAILSAWSSILVFVSSLAAWAADSPTSPNLIFGGDMKTYNELADPWGGVDIAGNLRGLTGSQLAVDDRGNIGNTPLSPSIAVGDLNGDGLLDLVVADPKGFIWYYPNSGTKTEPKFTHGEVIPIWLGSPVLSAPAYKAMTDLERHAFQSDHLVPRIQLVDFDGSGKLGIVAGTCSGKLFFIPNTGSAAQPKFGTPRDLIGMPVTPTRTDRDLDCNYLAPYVYNWFGDGRLALLRGDGTYSANSIFLYPNKGSNSQPVFTEEGRMKLIPGMGREHLSPQVVDWNNDGKPDVLTGEREGYVNLFLNTSQSPSAPTFDQGQKLSFGGQNKFGQFTTVATGAFSGNPATPDVLIANNTGNILYCRNTGTPGAPSFSATPQLLTGINPFPKIFVPTSWSFSGYDSFRFSHQGWNEGRPFGVPYELLVVTDATKEPGFAPPNGVTWKSALRYYVVDHKNVYFPESYYPGLENDADLHSIAYDNSVSLTSETPYQVSFWVKGNGIRDLKYHFHGDQLLHPGTGDQASRDVSFGNAVGDGDTWSHVVDTVSWASVNGKTHFPVSFSLTFGFHGQGNLYLSDVQLHQL